MSEQKARGRGRFKFGGNPASIAFPTKSFTSFEEFHTNASYIIEMAYQSQISRRSVAERSDICRLRVVAQNGDHQDEESITHRDIASIAIEHPTLNLQVSFALCLPLFPPCLFRLVVHQPINLPGSRIDDDTVPILYKCKRAA